MGLSCSHPDGKKYIYIAIFQPKLNTLITMIFGKERYWRSWYVDEDRDEKTIRNGFVVRKNIDHNVTCYHYTAPPSDNDYLKDYIHHTIFYVIYIVLNSGPNYDHQNLLIFAPGMVLASNETFFLVPQHYILSDNLTELYNSHRRNVSREVLRTWD